ncbi:mechanosensitive ion channel family protein [Robiginitalea sp. SC105]|uniref:mechanosensitive ion channel family protein n=1 Tax=Robiginitalea sp. SC105 TaxID=2762332 RepID=UPI001639D366|nr:mechanosensitive ion channel family protein [Robiginitalea sp. SC105]MBC2837873.1 mechanosensitive ion channel family protein [Robiginitalea sp. SC105]
MESEFAQAWGKMKEKLLGWVDTLILNLPNFLIALVVFIISVILSKYISRAVDKLLQRSSMQDSMRNLISRLVSIVVILLGLFLVLGILNLSRALNTILAGAGVAGLAVGLALQGALANTYSGIVLSYVKYIKFGDWIHTNGYEGEVVNIDLRSVTLRQPDNNMVYIPNKIVVENPIKNYSTTAQSRVILSCGVGYSSDLEQVRQVVQETIVQTFEEVGSAEDIIFLYTEFGSSSINFETRFWIESTSALQVANSKTRAMIAIKGAFDSEGINIPFPIRTLDFSGPLRVEHTSDPGSNT